MHLIQKKKWCIALALTAVLLCTACNAVPLSERRIVKALFFEQTRAECMVTLLLQQQDEESETAVFGRGNSFAEALYSAQSGLDGEVFYGTTEIAVFPYECRWTQAKTIGELLYDKVAPIPEISVFQFDGPIEQGNKGLYDKQFEKMKDAEDRYQFHWGLESVFAEENECVLPVLQEDGYSNVIIDKQGGENIPLQCGLETQLLAVLNGHGTKIDAEPAGISATVEGNAHIEYHRNRNTAIMTLVLDNVRWTSLQDSPQDRKEQEKALIDEIKSIYASNQFLFRMLNIDPFHVKFFSDIYGTDATNTELKVVLHNEKPDNTG